MKRLSWCLIFVLLFIGVFISAAAGAARGLQIQSVDPTTGEVLDLYQNSWAIIIGIDQYRNITPLDFAVSDAQSFKNLLTNKFKFPQDNIIYLSDAKATLNNIKEAFYTISKKAKPNDRVVVYFAGHGETEKLPLGGEMGYLIPVEGNINKIYLTSLPMSEIKILSDRIPAKHVLFIIDACYGGLAAVQSRAVNKNEKGYLKKVTKANARQIITAGGKNEQVIERMEWGHSAFTYKLIDGLDKELADYDDDGFITATELGVYLKSSVSKISNNQQTPKFANLTTDEGEFVFILAPKKFAEKVADEGGEGECYISSNIEGSSVWIDNEKVEGVTPLIVRDLPTGSHTIRLEKGEYVADGVVDIKFNEIAKVDLEMRLAKGGLTVITEPAGAHVSVDDQYKGITPLDIKEVSAGTHMIKIKKDGYSLIEKEIYVSGNKEDKFFESLKPLGMVAFTSNPPGAKIFIDEKYIGKTPLKWHLDGGSHHVAVNAEEYYEKNINIDVRPGKEDVVDVALEQYPLVTITSKPAEAAIYLDDRKIGKTPASVRLPVGVHDLVLEKENHLKKVTMFTVKKGGNNEVNEELIRQAGTLIVAANVSKAPVFIDNKKKGEIPLNINQIPTGDYEVVIQPEGYFPEKKSVTIEYDKIAQLDFQLTSVDSIDRRIKKYKTWKLLWAGTALATGGVGFLMNSSADKNYDEYLTSTSSSEAADLYDKYESGKKLSLISFVAGGVALIPAIINHFKAKKLHAKWYEERRLKLVQETAVSDNQ